MHIFRNPEVKKWMLLYGIYAVLAAVAAGVCFGSVVSSSGNCNVMWGFHGAVAGYVILICAVGAGIFIVATRQRYRTITKLSEQLDEILHGMELMNFVPDEEGELAVLSSEIYKMTVRLQEQAEALQRDKNYLKDAIADISHQIRTPLTSVRMLVTRLGREMDETQKSIQMQEIGKLLNRMEWQIEALLKMARLEAGSVVMEKNTVQITEVIDKALAPLEIMAEVKQITVRAQVMPEAIFTGDGYWVTEAIGNILKNSMEHLSEGGTLTIEASENPLYTEICIADDGSGISDEELPHLFKRFYKGKHAKPENAGIGLALAKEIITRQNGTIRAENRAPHGLEFQIHFYKGVV